MELKAIDINVPAETPIKSEGTAYYRIDDKFLKFLRLCDTKHGILGFEYDGTRNFGVILRNPAN